MKAWNFDEFCNFHLSIIGDGNVSFEEFVDILSNMTDATAESSADQEERELRDAFRVFDKHNRGYITASDLRAVLQCLGEDLDEDESEFCVDLFIDLQSNDNNFNDFCTQFQLKI